MIFKQKRTNEHEGVNMTPMLDIVFIMLIFFLVTASFIKETGLVVNHPKGTTPPLAQNNEVIEFQIYGQDQLFFEGRLVDIWAAEAIIKQLSTEHPDAPVVVSLMEGARLGSMVRLYDAALKNGIPKGSVAVITNS